MAFAIVEWIRQALQDAANSALSFRDVVKRFSALEEIVSLTSGSALTALWQLFSPAMSLFVMSEDNITSLENASRRLMPSSENMSEMDCRCYLYFILISPSELRMQISDVVSMWMLEARKDEAIKDLAALTARLENVCYSAPLRCSSNTSFSVSATVIEGVKTCPQRLA